MLPNFKVLLRQVLVALLSVNLGTHRRRVVVLMMVVPVIQVEVVLKVVLVVLIKLHKVLELEEERVEQHACRGQMTRKLLCSSATREPVV